MNAGESGGHEHTRSAMYLTGKSLPVHFGLTSLTTQLLQTRFQMGSFNFMNAVIVAAPVTKVVKLGRFCKSLCKFGRGWRVVADFSSLTIQHTVQDSICMTYTQIPCAVRPEARGSSSQPQPQSRSRMQPLELESTSFSQPVVGVQSGPPSMLRVRS